jgi:hypothetical protein
MSPAKTPQPIDLDWMAGPGMLIAPEHRTWVPRTEESGRA